MAIFPDGPRQANANANEKCGIGRTSRNRDHRRHLGDSPGSGTRLVQVGVTIRQRALISVPLALECFLGRPSATRTNVPRERSSGTSTRPGSGCFRRAGSRRTNAVNEVCQEWNASRASKLQEHRVHGRDINYKNSSKRRMYNLMCANYFYFCYVVIVAALCQQMQHAQELATYGGVIETQMGIPIRRTVPEVLGR
ncbi:hypothetical protein ACS0PU_008317 [Formica fusca]